ncbi:MAG: hypothetical protein LBM94_00890 [Propionibacteriaceae bacterium]|jgi:hypothetical protein|nr:hypothetical protein [Propionibacteriaceae bacterium]
MDTDTSTWVYEVRPPFPWRNIPGLATVIAVGIYLIVGTSFEGDQGYFHVMGFAIVPVAVLMGAAVMFHYFRSRLHVEMDTIELRATAPKLNVTIPWGEVTNWALDPKLRGVVIACGDERTRIMTPSGEADERMEIIADAISSRMAVFRGEEKRVQGPVVGGRQFVDARESRNFGFED